MDSKKTVKLRKERRQMEGATRDMERRLAEIKQLFEKEQIKSEKERLIWASAGDGKKQTKKKQLMADRQSRLILGKVVFFGRSSFI